MSYINKVHHDVKHQQLVDIKVENELHPKLNKNPILRHMNKSFFALILGKPGSGKSSTWELMLCDNKMFCHVFHHVYLFMPSGSLASFGEKSKLHTLVKGCPQQVFEEVTFQNLTEVLDATAQNSDDEYTSLVIFDDVQEQLKNKHVKNVFMKLIANRRHNRTSVIVAAQTYKRVPLEIRLMASDLFCFLPTPENEKQIGDEVIPFSKKTFAAILQEYRRYLTEKNKVEFLYINLNNGTVFIGWNEELKFEE